MDNNFYLDQETVFKIANQFWRTQFQHYYPDATAEELREAWDREKMHIRGITRRTLRVLERDGLVVAKKN